MFSVDHACDIWCSWEPCELIEVSSGTHEYESISFFGFLFHRFFWMVCCVWRRAAVLNAIALFSLQGGTKEQLCGGNSFVPP